MTSFKQWKPHLDVSLYIKMLWYLPACLSLSHITCSCLRVAFLLCSYLVSTVQELTNFFLVCFSYLDQFPDPEIVVPVQQEERNAEHKRRLVHISQIS